MTFEKAKKHFFNEEMEIALASEETMQKLATWLEKNGYDADFAWSLWESSREELEYLRAEVM
jgi:hypothetical protein